MADGVWDEQQIEGFRETESLLVRTCGAYGRLQRGVPTWMVPTDAVAATVSIRPSLLEPELGQVG